MRKCRNRDKKTSGAKRSIERQMYGQTDLRPEDSKTHLEVLAGVCKMIEQSSGGKQVFEKILNLLGKSVEFSRASLFLLDKSENQMEEVASIGKKVDLIDFVRFNQGLGLSAWVASEKRPILLSNLRRKRGGDGVRSFLAIPLLLDGELFGVMNFGHIRAHAFEPEEVNFLTLASIPVIFSLERMSYHAEIDMLNKDLSQAREHSRELQEKIRMMENMIPTSQLLENLTEKIKTPLSCITENAKFLLNSFSARQDDRSSTRLKKDFNLQFKRGLREIKNEVNQITKATGKLLKKGSLFQHS